MYAYQSIISMLEGREPMSLKKGIFDIENSLFTKSLPYKEFDSLIQVRAMFVKRYMLDKGYDLNSSLAINFAIKEFMSDTISFYDQALESQMYSYPFTYDFEDPFGNKDYSNTFVTKLLFSNVNEGQCKNMPLLFKLISNELGGETYISYASNHTYIKFKDDYGYWNNYETTNGFLTDDYYIMGSGFIDANAIRQKTYMHPETDKEILSRMLLEMVDIYLMKFGWDNPNLLIDICANAIKYRGMDFPEAHAHLHHIFNYELQRLSAIHNLTTEEEKMNSEHTSKIYQMVKTEETKIFSLGYVQLNQEEYETLRGNIQEDKEKQEKIQNQLSIRRN